MCAYLLGVFFDAQKLHRTNHAICQVSIHHPLHLLVDEMAEIVIRADVELGQQIVLSGDRVHFGDLLDPVYDFLGDLVGLPEMALASSPLQVLL